MRGQCLCDSSLKVIAMVLIFYLFKDKPLLQLLFALPLFYDFHTLGILASFGLISLYNGERGFIKDPYSKFLFYAFYPSHLIVTWTLLLVV